MNRNDNLKTSLESWLEVDGVDEIIIVDWSSDTPVHQCYQMIQRVRQ